MKHKINQISLLKGIGIISVVMGHCCAWSVPYVYMYHLPLFFFVAGAVYNEEKYGNNVQQLFLARMSSTMPWYLFYSLVLLSLRNPLLQLGIYNSKEIPPLTGESFIQNFVKNLYFGAAELLGSAFWFLPVLIVAVVLYGTVVAFSNSFHREIKIWIRITLLVLLVVIGLELIEKRTIVSLRLNISLIVLPFIAAGHIYRNFQAKIDKFLGRGGIAGVCAIIAILLPLWSGTYIELSINRIVNPLFFYGGALAGIVFWLWLTKKLLKAEFIAKLIAVCGNYSLDIMAMHLLAINLVDWIYLDYINPSAGVKDTFPYSVPYLWPVYLVVGVVVPILFRCAVNKIWSCIKYWAKQCGLIEE